MKNKLGENLYNDYVRCKDLCFKYNSTLPSNFNGRLTILNKILGKFDESTVITQPFYCDLGYNIEVGVNFYANHNCTILDAEKVTFGDNVFIAPNCCFSTVNHPLDAESRNEGIEYALPITVGDNVWFGVGCTVLSNVKIGNNTVIGAGSVVTRDIPENVVAFGNPCKVVRKITEKDKFDAKKHTPLVIIPR